MFVLSFNNSIFAQTLDSTKAGEVEKSVKRKEKKLEYKKEVPFVEKKEEEEEEGPEGPKILVKEFKFEGNKIFSDQELKEIVKDTIGKEYSFRALFSHWMPLPEPPKQALKGE